MVATVRLMTAQKADNIPLPPDTFLPERPVTAFFPNGTQTDAALVVPVGLHALDRTHSLLEVRTRSRMAGGPHEYEIMAKRFRLNN